MKIAVITCVNNEEEYAQALSYINRLHVPDGYELDVIAVREASSMAAGYQMAMEHTDARYKIYMHQDTFIINREFLRDMLSVFRSDDRIGAIGMVGCDDVPINAQAVAAWNVGCVYHNCIPARVQYTQRADRQPVDVEAVDGLLLATQHDVRWREDLSTDGTFTIFRSALRCGGLATVWWCRTRRARGVIMTIHTAKC